MYEFGILFTDPIHCVTGNEAKISGARVENQPERIKKAKSYGKPNDGYCHGAVIN